MEHLKHLSTKKKLKQRKPLNSHFLYVARLSGLFYAVAFPFAAIFSQRGFSFLFFYFQPLLLLIIANSLLPLPSWCSLPALIAGVASHTSQTLFFSSDNFLHFKLSVEYIYLPNNIW